MKKFIFISLAVCVLVFLKAGNAEAQTVTGVCGVQPALFPQCGTDRSTSCTVGNDAACCTGICVPPIENGITSEAQCNGDPACLQALAEARQDQLTQGHQFYVYQQSANKFIVVCNNGFFGGTYISTPTPTPTPSPPPACGSQCNSNNDCSQAGQCVDCLPNGSGGKTCQTPPPVCGSQCQTNNDCSQAGQCVDCLPNAGGQKVCQVPPTPTPTPFSPSMCHCDGMDASQIVPGQPTTFTANAKVQGGDINIAKVQDITFYLGAGDNTNATIIAQSDPIPAKVIQTTQGQVEYQATWTVTIPQLQKGTIYRAWSQINCVPNQHQASSSAVRTNNLILGTQTNQSIFDILGNWLKNLFTKNQPASSTTGASSGNQAAPAASPGGRNLQLNTFQFSTQPATVLEKACTVIRFQAE